MPHTSTLDHDAYERLHRTTVGRLIEALQAYDRDTLVLVQGYSGYDAPRLVEASVTRLLDTSEYTAALPGDASRGEVVPALLLVEDPGLVPQPLPGCRPTRS
jgi:hypothetical protein